MLASTAQRFEHLNILWLALMLSRREIHTDKASVQLLIVLDNHVSDGNPCMACSELSVPQRNSTATQFAEAHFCQAPGVVQILTRTGFGTTHVGQLATGCRQVPLNRILTSELE